MNEFSALKVNQWLKEWESVRFSSKENREQPMKHFYLFSIPAKILKSLSGIQRRTTRGGLLRSRDLGVQRRHDEKRSEKIYQFVKYGYPWSELKEEKRKSGEFNELRKPGWLPTAIVINILKKDDERNGEKVSSRDLLEINDVSGSESKIKMPASYKVNKWEPYSIHPIEVIDGQHRLWAFDDVDDVDTYELPVVAYHGLDISWQAYLFWTINMEAKRINPSLAFDLYPLLRTEDWLEKLDGHSIYKKTGSSPKVVGSLGSFSEVRQGASQHFEP